MRLTCMAVVEDERQRQNLCECIGILGGEPKVLKDEVLLKYDGDKTQVDKFTELFAQYTPHEICYGKAERK